jgi:hypothetical protein
MLLPEHKEALLEYNIKNLIVTYAGKYGPNQFWGWVKAIDRINKKLKIVNDEDILLVSKIS